MEMKNQSLLIIRPELGSAGTAIKIYY